MNKTIKILGIILMVLYIFIGITIILNSYHSDWNSVPTNIGNFDKHFRILGR
jgi:hypothetical protein